MLNYKRTEDTICALATPSGHGGIAIIRVSGPGAKKVCSNIIDFPEKIESHRAYFLNINSINKDRVLDEALVTYFSEGKSYTGEETMEISCHGSPIVVEEILQALVESGARMAEKGEFTFRSFMSGNLDLLQAESVLTLIQSETQKGAAASLRQLKGGLSQSIHEIKNKILKLLAHLEASIDFSMEDLSTIDHKRAHEEIEEIFKLNKDLLNTYKAGKILTENLTVVLAGEPNTGKSSLFNQFIKKEKAIVTEVAGTTRDSLEAFINIGGAKVKFVDTAGLRDTQDRLEKMGIEKTWDQILEADQIFYVIDATVGIKKQDEEFLSRFKDKTSVLVNKTDLSYNETDFLNLEKTQTMRVFPVSAKRAETLESVMFFLEDNIKQTFQESSAVVLKARQFDLLDKMSKSLARAKELSLNEASTEFVAFELREALENTLELLGQSFDDQVLEKIFQEFCIGK